MGIRTQTHVGRHYFAHSIYSPRLPDCEYILHSRCTNWNSCIFSYCAESLTPRSAALFQTLCSAGFSQHTLSHPAQLLEAFPELSR